MKFVRSPIGYIGSKYKLLEYVWELIPDTDRIVSPFFGGGSIEINLSYQKKVSIFACDICPYLIIFWKHFVNNPEQVFKGSVDLFQSHSFEELQSLHESYTSSVPDDNLNTSAIFYLFNKLAFRGCGLTHGIRKQQYDKGLKVLGKRQSMYVFDMLFRKTQIDFHCCDFSESLVGSDDLVICDPPYVSTELYQGGSSTASKHLFNHHLLNCLLKDRDNWILFYNHCPELPYVKLAYAGYYYLQLDQLSTLSNKNFINWVLFSHDVAESLLEKGFDLQKA